ncbi:MAG: prepilin-type N-terminal cleavage/methylation domain-containing protein [Candidatus Saganbacteria bacterium]|nr:prepilin-type N-terminal cleavage/methylation domain-containing protein [Candidatus Saganbacteria bacterium]
MKKKARYGFTLVELIVVIAILAILAAAVMSRWVNLQTQAKISSDEAVIGAFKTAVAIKHAANIIDGTGDVWPGSPTDLFTGNNPFSILSPAPQIEEWNNWSPDSNTWVYEHFSTPRLFAIACPHYNSTVTLQYQIAPVAGITGTRWWYNYGTSPWQGIQPGECGQRWLGGINKDDWGH